MIAVLYSDLSPTSLIHILLRFFCSTCVLVISTPLKAFYTPSCSAKRISKIHANYMGGFGDHSLNCKWQYADLEYFLFYIRAA